MISSSCAENSARWTRSAPPHGVEAACAGAAAMSPATTPAMAQPSFTRWPRPWPPCRRVRGSRVGSSCLELDVQLLGGLGDLARDRLRLVLRPAAERVGVLGRELLAARLLVAQARREGLELRERLPGLGGLLVVRLLDLRLHV